jgi:peptidyl-prolyl cis-trans isomerase B (cyclophilin B)
MLVRPAVLALLLPLPLAVAALAGCGGSDEPTAADNSTSAPAGGTSCTYDSDGQTPAKDVDPPPATATLTGSVQATMTTSVGDIKMTLDADKAPCTVNSFVSLADQGYFDDTPCHRLTTEQTGIFVLQCGDPTGTGTGGPGYTIEDELDPSDTYPPGTVAMARTPQPNSGGSQFFLVYDDTPLPADYVVFGHMDAAGLKVVRGVAKDGTDDASGPGDGHPTTAVQIESVTVG